MKLKPTSKELMRQLIVHPHWKDLLEDLKSLRPVVPSFNFNQKGEDNLTEIKYRSLQQQGFDKLFNVLGVTNGTTRSNQPTGNDTGNAVPE